MTKAGSQLSMDMYPYSGDYAVSRKVPLDLVDFLWSRVEDQSICLLVSASSKIRIMPVRGSRV